MGLLSLQLIEGVTVFDRMSAQGANLILGPRGEALIQTKCSFERGHSLKCI